MMKRTLIKVVLLVCILSILLVVACGCGEEKPTEGLVYNISSNGTYVKVTDYTGSATKINIPATYNNLPVTTIEKEVFKDTDIKAITIPDSITSIGKGAFENCESLSKVYITSIESWCKISFGDHLANPLFYAGELYLNDQLVTDVVIPNGTTKIGDYAFNLSSSLTSITIPDSVTSIGKAAFQNCISLQTVNMGKGVTDVGQNAFYGCSALTSIEIPSKVKSLYEGVFYGCSSLQKITLPFIGSDLVVGSYSDQYPFGYVFGTTEYTGAVATEQTYYNYRGDSLIEIYYIPTSLKTVTITGGEISEYAFINCTGLSDVTLGDNVTAIEAGAFYGCFGLTNLSIGSGIEYIGSGAFFCCFNLQYNVNNNINYLGNKERPYLVAVSVASKTLSTYNIHQDTKVIMSNAFANCTNLLQITIPDGVVNIGSGAFNGCSSLQKITLPFVGSSKNITNGKFAFGYIFGITKYDGGTATTQYRNTYYIPNTLKSVTVTGGTLVNNSFYGCTGLTSITLGNKISTIEENAFYGCSGLTSIVIPDSVTSIAEGAFAGCSSLEEITLPFIGGSKKTSTATYQYPFGYIFGTDSYTGSKATSQTYVGSTSNSTTSATYYIPASLKSVTITGGDILQGAFSNCSNITNITVPDSATTIASKAFYKCSSLVSIVVPDSVTSIAQGAFAGCSSLQEMTLPFVGGSKKTSTDTYQYPFGYIFGTQEYTGSTIATQTYYGSSIKDTTKKSYYVPTSLKTITITGGEILYGAFYNCSQLTSIKIPSDITSIGDYAFYGCKGLTDITLPKGITSIGSSMFSGCTSLTSVIIPSGVVSIGTNAFYNCSKLTSILIPKSVENISNMAFYSCSKLTTIYYEGTYADWENITISSTNSTLSSDKVYCYSENKMSSLLGNFWHYVNGVPTKWE